PCRPRGFPLRHPHCSSIPEVDGVEKGCTDLPDAQDSSRGKSTARLDLTVCRAPDGGGCETFIYPQPAARECKEHHDLHGGHRLLGSYRPVTHSTYSAMPQGAASPVHRSGRRSSWRRSQSARATLMSSRCCHPTLATPVP